MKTFRSSFLRPFGSLVHGTLVMGMLLAGWLGFVSLVMWSNEGNPKPMRKRAALRHPLFAVPAGLALLIGIPVTASAFARSRGRYRLGPTEIEVTGGWLSRETRTIPYGDIRRVDSSRGLLMRLLGTTDLRLDVERSPDVHLYGIRGADEVREHLLARAESLRELKRDEDADARTVARLTGVLERLEKKLDA